MDFYINEAKELSESINRSNIGDSLYVDSIDCLGKSIYDINEVLKLINEKHLKLVISNNINLDFLNEQNVFENVIKLLDSICDIQKNRVRQSVKKAIEEGKPVGRKKLTLKDIPTIFFDNLERYEHQELNKTEFAKLCGCSRPTLNKWLAYSYKNEH